MSGHGLYSELMAPVFAGDRNTAVSGRVAGAGNLADNLPAPVQFSIPTPPSVNEIFRNLPGRGRVKTSLYDDFVRRGITAIRNQKVSHVPGNVIAVFGVERMSLSSDIDNRLKAMLDTIVKARVIDDDRFVTAIALSWLPKANGLAWVQLLPVQRLTLTFLPSNSGSSGGWYQSEPQPEEGDDPDGYLAIQSQEGAG